jgi:hypothetical protein
MINDKCGMKTAMAYFKTLFRHPVGRNKDIKHSAGDGWAEIRT